MHSDQGQLRVADVYDQCCGVELTVSDPAVDYGAGDTVVISTKSTSAEECECAGVYTVQSSGLSATAVPVLPSLSDEVYGVALCGG